MSLMLVLEQVGLLIYYSEIRQTLDIITMSLESQFQQKQVTVWQLVKISFIFDLKFVFMNSYLFFVNLG